MEDYADRVKATDRPADLPNIESELSLEQRFRLDEQREHESEQRYLAARMQAQQKRAKLAFQRRAITIVLVSLSMPLAAAGVFGIQAVIDKWPLLLGGAFVIAAIITSASVGSSSSFLDVDRERRITRLNPAAAWPFPTGSRPGDAEDKDDDLGDKEGEKEIEFFDEADEQFTSTTKFSRVRLESDPFGAYFFDLKKILERKADDADAKASILLDKGTNYTKLGIWFFGISIFIWQVLAWVHGFQNFYIYGIASCSALFVFIEFISAWFLKQYRQYVDTSTYLLRVKAIFDRFMLVYLATKSGGHSISEEEDKRLQMLIELLSREITWPETYLQKQQDIGFAKEAMEAITLLTKEMRSREAKKDSATT
ncbi:hypothetical protein SAMN04487926_12226 [Paraburkholderia steynii]|uniref:Uncharacterized protein n=1 Tax=Paraburkholderia steynii TaxID=1245441 RepID=A0A7Z7BC97_9BURK|nr:hypothetical protein [Paraburkholderia steynii]SDI70002.1 hypothetical protein SAMN04487926_12226 [Paraburkholderia steynii]